MATKDIKLSLCEQFEKKAQECENWAKDAALEALVGKGEGKKAKEDQARMWYAKACVWREALQKVSQA